VFFCFSSDEGSFFHLPLWGGFFLATYIMVIKMSNLNTSASASASMSTSKMYGFYTCSTQVEPGVEFHCHAQPSPHGYYQYEYGLFGHILCADFDWPDSGHLSDLSITVKTATEVLNTLRRIGGTWRLYITPGGMRAFLVSEKITVQEMEEGKAFFQYKELNADPLYWGFTQSYHKKWGFRLVPKLGRHYDWIAEFLEVVGDPADADPELVRLVETYHDQQIITNRGYEELSKEQWDIIIDKL
jgi:hypothetical protein